MKARYQQLVSLNEEQMRRLENLKNNKWKSVEIFMLGVTEAEKKNSSNNDCIQ